MEISEKKTVDRYHVYVGLSHGTTFEQKFDTEKYISLVDYICKNNNIAYTLGTTRGGYQFISGKYVNENSLDVMMIDAPLDVVELLSSELCAMLGQECVMVTHDTVEMFYLSDSIE